MFFNSLRLIPGVDGNCRIGHTGCHRIEAVINGAPYTQHSYESRDVTLLYVPTTDLQEAGWTLLRLDDQDIPVASATTGEIKIADYRNCIHSYTPTLQELERVGGYEYYADLIKAVLKGFETVAPLLK